MSTERRIDFSKVNEAAKQQDVLNFHMGEKVKLCQQVSGLNFRLLDLEPKEELLRYQRCMEQAVRLDYDFTLQRAEIEEQMSRAIYDQWHGKGFF